MKEIERGIVWRTYGNSEGREGRLGEKWERVGSRGVALGLFLLKRIVYGGFGA
jgi:hypothetical protein